MRTREFPYTLDSLFRGQVRSKLDTEVTREDALNHHLILWGDPRSNLWIRKLFEKSGDGALPFDWNQKQIRYGQESVRSSQHVLQCIFPNTLADQTRPRYLVVNTGPTFRQAHDRTNSLQNPHLPDWAVIDLDEPPSAMRPGRIHAAGFFDDAWKLP